MSKPKEKKKPIPLTISGVAYITTSGIIRYCTAGTDAEGRTVPLPKDFKEWAGQASKKAVQGQEFKI